MESLVEFLGRRPNSDAFLSSIGLSSAREGVAKGASKEDGAARVCGNVKGADPAETNVHPSGGASSPFNASF